MYNSYFGFQETPFSVTPDPHFFYTNSIYREAFAALLYGIKAKKGFIVITGEVGTGKTTLLRKLMRNLEATTRSVFIFNTHLRFPELLQLILHDLGLDNKGKNMSTMIQELNDYLIQELKKGHSVSLLIDEAQGLTDEALEGLRLLSNLETDREKLLQMVLVGQPELDTKLNRFFLRQLKQRVAIRCHLEPLTHSEVGDYIRHRLQVAGYDGRGIFSKQAIESIWGYSQGIPRPINMICDNALLNAFAASQKKISADMIREVAHDLRLEPESQAASADIAEESNVQVPKADAATAKVITSRDEAFRVLKAKAPEEPKVQVQKLETGNPKVPSKDEVVGSFTDDALQGFEDLGSRSLGRLAVGTLLVLLLLGGLASVTLQNKDRLQGLSLGVANLIAIAGEGLEVLKHRLAILTSREEEVQAPLGSKPPALQANLQGQELSNPDTEPLALADQSEPAGSLDRQKGEDPERLEDLIDARLPSPTNSYPREAIEE